MVKQLPLDEMQQHWDKFVKNVTDKMNDTLQDQIEMLTLQLKDQEEQYTTLQTQHANLNLRHEELNAGLDAIKIYGMKVVNLESQVGRNEKEIIDLKAELKIQCQNRDYFLYQTLRFIGENTKFREQTTRLVEEKRKLQSQICCATQPPCGGCFSCLEGQASYSISQLDTLSDDGALNIICDKILANNAHSIVDYKKGKLNALNHLKGQIMKETKGKADIQKVELLLKSKMI